MNLYQFLHRLDQYAKGKGQENGHSRRPGGRRNRHRASAWRPALETPEGRTLPSTAVHGDFNGNGYSDMAVGIPGATAGGVAGCQRPAVVIGPAEHSCSLDLPQVHRAHQDSNLEPRNYESRHG
jgi:hypothetical protein